MIRDDEEVHPDGAGDGRDFGDAQKTVAVHGMAVDDAPVIVDSRGRPRRNSGQGGPGSHRGQRFPE